jgi:Zinc finger, C3HC4 type (RING finger)
MQMESPTRCVICLEDLAEDVFDAPCAHKLHVACATQYVREWRLDRSDEPVPCPMCKSTETFAGQTFEWGPADAAEQNRRKRSRAREQMEEDRSLARQLFFEEFEVPMMLTRRRRQSMRGTEFSTFFFVLQNTTDRPRREQQEQQEQQQQQEE